MENVGSPIHVIWLDILNSVEHGVITIRWLAQMMIYLKGYFQCKTVTSQNVSSEAQVKNFLFRRNVMFLSRGIQFFCIFNHPVIYQICDVVMSISTWDRAHFWIYLLNHNSLSHQIWSMIDISKGNIFLKSFWTIWSVWARSFSI